ncbi:MAG: glycoside hydrolase family 13 [Candidatus Tectimicrobiota bacterium]
MTTHPDLHRYLDGEIPLEALPDDLKGEAEAWARVHAALAETSPRAPATLATRVMQGIRGLQPRSGPLDWLLAPRPLRPLAVLAAAAIAFLLAFPVARLLSDRGGQGVDRSRAVDVQFVFHAPGARSVAVAGDFNGWLPDAFPLSDEDGDGIWTGLFPVREGIHKYMFIVDGERWLTDPFAPAYVDDGFGGKNALLEVIRLNGHSS